MNLFIELSIVIVIATLIAGIAKLLKQPVILAYIVTGIALGPAFLGLFKSVEEIEIFSEIGIAILLFIVGLHLSPKDVSHLGKKVFLIGLFQVISTIFLVLGIAKILGFSTIESLYLGVALSFSSTIIVLKILTDKKELEKLYGKISVGVLLLQDLVAAIALITVSAFSGPSAGFIPFLILIAKGILFTLGAAVLSVGIMPRLSKFFAKSQDYLLLFSISWGLGFASLANYLGFSLELGALIAGVALSVSPYSIEISSRLKPLKEFFVVIFFVLLGAKISFEGFQSLVVPFVYLLVFVVIGKPLIIYLFSKLFKYNSKVSFKSGFIMSQISEFSIILVLLGYSTGHLKHEFVTLITLLSIVSIGISSYVGFHLDKLADIFGFSKRKTKEFEGGGKVYEVILFGCNRAGYDFIKMFRDMKDAFLAVDFDPDIVEDLSQKGINAMYGDAEDIEFLDDINAEKAKIVISTIPDFETNKFLVEKLRLENEKTLIMSIAYDIDHALELYKLGASYVILPHFIGGAFAVKIANEANFDVDKIHSRRDRHVDYLKERKELGHAHPKWSHY